MTMLRPIPVSWTCPDCDAGNTDHIDAEPIPYYCLRCGHAFTLRQILRASATRQPMEGAA